MGIEHFKTGNGGNRAIYTNSRFSKKDCIESVRRAKETIGHSPSVKEYRKLDIRPSDRIITERLGSWSKALDEANLETRKHGVTQESKSMVNEQYFHCIDTAEKSYWLGFIYGDGCVTDPDSKTGRIFTISLHSDDTEHLEKFKQSIDSQHSLCEVDNRHYTNLPIHNEVFVDGLVKHGVTHNKTHNNVVPAIDPDLRPHFVRGLFDADGSLREDRWVITSSSMGRMEVLKEWIGVDDLKVRDYNEHSWKLATFKQKSIHKVLQYIYPSDKDTSPSLTRKLKTAEGLYE